MRQTLILASGSPRRRELLEKMGVSYVAHPSEADEHVNLPPREAVRVLAGRKARAAAADFSEGIVLGADTLVALDGAALGKPADAEQAKAMLSALSGRSHEVYTGVCLLDAKTGRALDHVEETVVFFRPLTNAEIDAYVASGEPMDKAGAYAIQGGAGAFVREIRGSYENVMGLPVQALQKMLEEFGG